MKELLVIIDGMDDEPIPALGNLTPVEAACMPALRFMRQQGKVTRQLTVPQGYETATDTALLSILGADLNAGFSSRSWFEAQGAGINVGENDLCLRCNLISHDKGMITSHSAEGLTEEETGRIIAILNKHFTGPGPEFFATGSFRNLLVIRNCNATVRATGPHNLLGEPLSSLEIDSDDIVLNETLNNLIRTSIPLLRENGFPATGIALWSPGRKPASEHSVKGSIIAGVPLVKGIGKFLGMNVVEVKGATGDENTDLHAKLDAAISSLCREDFVILHIEAADELSHRRDPNKKIRFLEKIDKELLKPLLDNLHHVNIRVQADHATSSLTGRHLAVPVEVTEYFLNR